MMNGIKIDSRELQDAVKDALSEYGDAVLDVLSDAIEKTAEETAEDLKSAGSFKGKKYRKTWKSEIEINRGGVSATVYNAKNYQLTHLLEFGHAIKSGGRTVGQTRAFPHIEAENEKAQKRVLELLEEGVSKL